MVGEIIDRALLIHVRSIVIQLLNALDDALCMPRTIPSKSERRVLKKNECYDTIVK